MNASTKPLEVAFAIASNPQPPTPGKRGLHRVGPLAGIREGERQIIQVGTLSVGVYRINGALHAIKNQCPHQGAPLCLGHLGATHAPGKVDEFQPALHGRVLRCPWHGWEFDVASGKGLYDAKSRVKTYQTVVDEEGIVWVDL